jgi:hypothetical protein
MARGLSHPRGRAPPERYWSEHPGCCEHSASLSDQQSVAAPLHPLVCQLHPGCPPHDTLVLKLSHGRSSPAHWTRSDQAQPWMDAQ